MHPISGGGRRQSCNHRAGRCQQNKLSCPQHSPHSSGSQHDLSSEAALSGLDNLQELHVVIGS
jgi:hypothetical protein